MDEKIAKLNTIKEEIDREKTAGKLRMFILISRTDLEGKWDILFSADWLEKTNSENDLIYLITKLKNIFNNDISFIARIISTKPEEEFIKKIAKALIDSNARLGTKINDLAIYPELTIKEAYVIALDFNGINLADSGTVTGPIAVKNLSKF